MGQLTGSVAVSPNGYVWYTFQEAWTDWMLGSFFLEEAFREATKPERLYDMMEECVLESELQGLLTTHVDAIEAFSNRVDAMCTMALFNCRYPQEPDYLNPQVFNKSTYFDVELLNKTIYDGLLKLCITNTALEFAKPDLGPQAPKLATSDANEGFGWQHLSGNLIMSLGLYFTFGS